jgi:hypothetical protein
LSGFLKPQDYDRKEFVDVLLEKQFHRKLLKLYEDAKLKREDFVYYQKCLIIRKKKCPIISNDDDFKSIAEAELGELLTKDEELVHAEKKLKILLEAINNKIK